MAWGAEIQPDTKPRWLTGTWSEIVAVRADVSMQKPIMAIDQNTPTPAMVVWRLNTMSDAAKTTVPARIQGRRRPNREVVRSDRAPVSG